HALRGPAPAAAGRHRGARPERAAGPAMAPVAALPAARPLGSESRARLGCLIGRSGILDREG
ncbi:hypothetical protein AB0D38_10020, partial [Streptomyces sp. NPDC048279]|uniref:hypothetical protein n=1 Tax=Streptomyces sp. NPDC048279 TaxID=3154714 RepID=UPI00341DEC85